MAFSRARKCVVHEMLQRCRPPLGWGCGRGDGGVRVAVVALFLSGGAGELTPMSPASRCSAFGSRGRSFSLEFCLSLVSVWCSEGLS